MFTWFRCYSGCKVILPILAAVSITLFSIVPFSASAADDPFDEIEYTLFTFDLFEAFPYDLTSDQVGHDNFLKVTFYDGNDFHHNSSQIKTLDLVANDISRGDSLSSWDCYLRTYNGFASRSCYATFPLKPLYFYSDINYLFDFHIKLTGLNGNISYGFYLDQMNIEFGDDLSTLSFTPSSVYGVGTNVVAHFQFIVPGVYLDDISERIFKFYFSMPDTPQRANSVFQMWLDPSNAFSIRPLSNAEEDYYTQSKYTADAIAGIGSNVPPVNMSGSGSDVQNLTDTAAAIDEQYALDPGQTSEAMSNAASLFSESGFVDASNVIKTWINLFLESNVAIYSMLVCCLGLGLAFFAIGRSSSG